MSLVETKHLEDFESILRELEFDDGFRVSMKAWCETGTRPYLGFWHVFIEVAENEPIAVCGLYRLTWDPSDRYWVGWFGVRPAWRRLGHASRILSELKHLAEQFGGKELLVYTEHLNAPALALYVKNGFTRIGIGSDFPAGTTAEPSDIVLRHDLTALH